MDNHTLLPFLMFKQILKLGCNAGNGVFRSTFVSILLGPQAGILTNWLWSFLNAGIQVRTLLLNLPCSIILNLDI